MEEINEMNKTEANEINVTKKERVHFERSVVITSILSFVVIVFIFWLTNKIGFLPEDYSRYSVYIFYGILAIVANATAVYHLKSYRNAVTCMMGMMIGMTIGMISGFTLGYVIGATNGMFIGSVYGMLIGIATGIWCGSCCGIMGTLEGAMAGLMGGTMGAMLSVMLLFDNINIFTPIFFLVCLSILYGLGYMVYRENKDCEDTIIKPYPLVVFFLICFALSILTTLVILYAPRSGLV